MPRIEAEIKLDFQDVLLRPQRSSLRTRAEVVLERTTTFRTSTKSLTGVPIVAANMDTVGTFRMAEVLASYGMFTAVHKYYSVEQWKTFAEEHPKILDKVAVSSGSGESDFSRLKSIIEAIPQVQLICLDVANGYSDAFSDFVARVRSTFPKHIIMAGNVVTGQRVKDLLEAGADIIKVGIGPGSVCTTRRIAGVGYPQLSAIIECSEVAHQMGGHIVSDGGCTCPGDVAKAFGAGADFVMLGGMLAGHDQSGGQIVEENGKKYKLFYGMSSATAMDKYNGGVADYRASEGRTVRMPYKGDVTATIKQLLGGVRSASTYVGASKIEQMPDRTTFIRVNRQLNEVFSKQEI